MDLPSKTVTKVSKAAGLDGVVCSVHKTRTSHVLW